MAEIKTKVNEASVEEFLSKVEDEQKRKDSFEIVKIMKQVTKEEPKMWGPAIIGFGSYHYKYESGREGDMPQIAFSPRKQNITLYIGVGDNAENPLLKKLGKYTTGKGVALLSLPPLRTVRATFIAYRSSISKALLDGETRQPISALTSRYRPGSNQTFPFPGAPAG